MISNLGEQNGDGLFMREPGVLPPASRKLLSQVGSEQVKSFKLVRTPLSSATRFLLNIATLGQYEKALKDINVDKFFHLRAIINDKYSLEKNEVIRFYKSNKIESGAQVLDVIIPQNNPTTIQEMMDKTKAQMGDDKFTNYDAETNNCGVFLNNVLSANGWLTSQASNFTLQKTNELFSKFPSLSKMVVNLGTKLGAVASRVIEGEGNCQCGGRLNPNDNIIDEEKGYFSKEEVDLENQAIQRRIEEIVNEMRPLDTTNLRDIETMIVLNRELLNLARIRDARRRFFGGIEEIPDEIQEQPVREEDIRFVEPTDTTVILPFDATSRETLENERNRLTAERADLVNQFFMIPEDDEETRDNLREQIQERTNTIGEIFMMLSEMDREEQITGGQRMTSGIFFETSNADELEYNFQLKKAKLLF